MNRIEERYYKFNQVLLKILGLWPYQQSYFARIQKVFLSVLCLTFIVAQLLVLVTTQYDTNLLFSILSFVFPILFVSIKYWLFIIQTDSIKQLLKQIRNDLGLLRHKFEIHIIEKYASSARSFVVNVTVVFYLSTFFFTIHQSSPLILDIILPLNESRPCQLFVMAEYFFNQEKYVYVILLHEILVFFFGMTILCSTGGTFLMYILHICALFDIASFHIENAIAKNTLAVPSPKRENLLYQRLVYAIVIHQRAIECVVFFVSNFALLFALLIMVGVSSLCFNLFQFLQIITLTKNINHALVIALIIVAHLFYMFVANNAGQEITDHGRKPFRATYNGLWYVAPLHTQKLLLFIMQKGATNVTLTLGSLFVTSLEGFATLVNVAVSYFMVIYSTQ